MERLNPDLKIHTPLADVVLVPLSTVPGKFCKSWFQELKAKYATEEDLEKSIKEPSQETDTSGASGQR